MRVRAPKVPPRADKKAAELGKILLRALEEIGPLPELAARLERVYLEEHGKANYGHEGG